MKKLDQSIDLPADGSENGGIAKLNNGFPHRLRETEYSKINFPSRSCSARALVGGGGVNLRGKCAMVVEVGVCDGGCVRV